METPTPKWEGNWLSMGETRWGRLDGDHGYVFFIDLDFGLTLISMDTDLDGARDAAVELAIEQYKERNG